MLACRSRRTVVIAISSSSGTRLTFAGADVAFAAFSGWSHPSLGSDNAELCQHLSMIFGHPGLIPELDVSDFAASMHFYVDIFGFSVLYDRPDEQFAMLEFEGTRLMVHAASGSRFLTGAQQQPFGRNVHFEMRVNDVDSLHLRMVENEIALFMPMEEKWLKVNDELTGNRQFAVADPDGFLFRPFTELGRKPLRTDHE